MAPAYLHILMEIHGTPVLEECPHLEHAVGTDGNRTLSVLIEAGLVRHNEPKGMVQYIPHGLELTPKGRAFVDYLCDVPLPQESFTCSAPVRSYGPDGHFTQPEPKD